MSWTHKPGQVAWKHVAAEILQGVSGCPRQKAYSWIPMPYRLPHKRCLNVWGHQRQQRALVRCRPLPEILRSIECGQNSICASSQVASCGSFAPSFYTWEVAVLWQGGSFGCFCFPPHTVLENTLVFPVTDYLSQRNFPSWWTDTGLIKADQLSIQGHSDMTHSKRSILVPRVDSDEVTVTSWHSDPEAPGVITVL